MSGLRSSRAFRTVVGVLSIWTVSAACSFAGERAAAWQAGFARTVITPAEPMWLSGYGGRNKPAEGKIHDLYARAAALRDPAGHVVVFVSTDLIGIPAGMARAVSERVEKKHGIKRAGLMLTCSHTHCGPALDGKLSHMLAMQESDWALVRKYQKQLNDNLVAVIGRALQDLQPARLLTGNGKCGVAVNRRPPIGDGPVDHDVPVLKVTSADGKKLRGVIFGYACHNTTLSFYKWCGDYAGFASLALEDRHPDAVALFFAGCGADQNPLPRRTVELAEKYGRMLAISVERVLKTAMSPVNGEVHAAFETTGLEFDSVPGKAHWERDLKGTDRYLRARAALLLAEIEQNGALAETYPFPIQIWTIGENVTWVALGGEVVVDYSLRLKKELGPGDVWVAGYANDVMAYVPSERVLKEGGYEGATSMIYYQQPSKWKAGLEDQIVKRATAITKQLRQRAPAAK